MPEDRRWKHCEFGRLSQYESISSTIASLQEVLEAEQAGVWKDLSIQIETKNDYGDTHNYIAIVGKRLETDEEVKLRLKTEADSQRYEREQYLRLKDKFKDNP